MAGIMTPGLAIIAAVARNGVIGAANTLPWRIPEDLARFRALTTGHAILMGRKTWQSLPRPLPNRQNIVITRQAEFVAPGALVVHSLSDALARVDLPLPAYCIGGGELYAVALPHADTLEMTEIDRDFAGDAWFPPFAPGDWHEVRREPHVTAAPEAMAYSFVTYKRNR
jgi:dihydrofolate reductase